MGSAATHVPYRSVPEAPLLRSPFPWSPPPCHPDPCRQPPPLTIAADLLTPSPFSRTSVASSPAAAAGETVNEIGAALFAAPAQRCPVNCCRARSRSVPQSDGSLSERRMAEFSVRSAVLVFISIDDTPRTSFTSNSLRTRPSLVEEKQIASCAFSAAPPEPSHPALAHARRGYLSKQSVDWDCVSCVRPLWSISRPWRCAEKAK